jgi:hypothetical protein
MNETALVVAVLNFVMCAGRLLVCLRNGRLQSVMWFLITYFSFFFIPLALEKEVWHYRGFVGDYLVVRQSGILDTLWYVLSFNAIFLIADVLFSWLFQVKKVNLAPLDLQGNRYVIKMQWVFAALLAFGTVRYALNTMGHGYLDYVNFKGSSWGMVFLWAAAPLVTLSALRKQYVVALLATVPYLAFMMQMNIRSFALLSAIPLAILVFLQLLQSGRADLVSRLRSLIIMAVFAVAALLMSTLVLTQKGEAHSKLAVFPDSGMPVGSAIMMYAADKQGVRTEWNALILYGANIINPFRRLMGLESPAIVDPPAVMAQLFDGVPEFSETYFHYPALWYADAYLAFGQLGLLLAILWALITVLWEKVMTRNGILLCISLPFFSWHAYMLVRGAIAGATVPFLYAAWVAMIVAFVLGGFRVMEGERHESRARDKLAFNWGS